MGRFLNPDNGAFSEAVNSEIYIDKTRLLEYINQVINTTSKFICNSRPRRFGKSMTADMLSAYYSRGCDSKELFKNYEISTVSSYEKNLNKYDVIHFDVQWAAASARTQASPMLPAAPVTMAFFPCTLSSMLMSKRSLLFVFPEATAKRHAGVHCFHAAFSDI